MLRQSDGRPDGSHNKQLILSQSPDLGFLGYQSSPEEELCAETRLFILISTAPAVALWHTSHLAEIGRFSTEFFPWSSILANKMVLGPRYLEQRQGMGLPCGLLSVTTLLLEADGLDDDAGDGVGVAVGAGPPVLEVPVARLGHVPGDPDGGAPVRHASREVVDR